MGRPDDDRSAERPGIAWPSEPACDVASGRSLDGARSNPSVAAGSRVVTCGFTDGDDVPVRSADAGEPAADRIGLTALLIPPVRGDAGVVGGHQAVAVGDRQAWGI